MPRIKSGPLFLVAIDGSPPSDRALAYAFELSKRLKARLRVVTVEDIGIVRAEAVAGAGLLALGYESGESAREAIAKAKGAAANAGVEPDFALLPLAEPAAAVVREAEAGGASLIIVGSHGRTGIARALLGSVAERVVRHAHCSVLVVR